MGIKRVAVTGKHGESEATLRRVRHLFVNRANMRAALRKLVNATFAVRDEMWWGTGTACASDSRKFGAWSSNLMTEWHQRYRGPGVMIYWHVERKSVCIYSRLKSCSASEVASMIEGVLRHCTDMEVASSRAGRETCSAQVPRLVAICADIAITWSPGR
ncbi:Tn3 family transposase [Streptomyces sp. NPDC058049]|uniref:Tn3 family transposase n=1 Tax=Streptomyces sp. NPDC058049 TaxID=3346314 RepID=UPI0036E130BE